MWRLKAAFLLLLLFPLLNCSDESDPEESHIMFVHASPDSPPVDIFLNDQKRATVSFLDHTIYLKVISGEQDITIKASGTDEILLQKSLSVFPRNHSSVFVFNNRQNLEIMTFTDKLKEDAPNIAVRFINLAPDSPFLELLTNGTTMLEFRGIEFKNFTRWLTLPENDPELELRRTNDQRLVPIPYFDNEMDYIGGKTYTMFVHGFLHGEPPADVKVIVNSDISME